MQSGRPTNHWFKTSNAWIRISNRHTWGSKQLTVSVPLLFGDERLQTSSTTEQKVIAHCRNSSILRAQSSSPSGLIWKGAVNAVKEAIQRKDSKRRNTKVVSKNKRRKTSPQAVPRGENRPLLRWVERWVYWSAVRFLVSFERLLGRVHIARHPFELYSANAKLAYSAPYSTCLREWKIGKHLEIKKLTEKKFQTFTDQTRSADCICIQVWRPLLNFRWLPQARNCDQARSISHSTHGRVYWVSGRSHSLPGSISDQWEPESRDWKRGSWQDGVRITL